MTDTEHPETYEQRPVSQLLIPAVPARRGQVKTELFQSVIELNTDVCESTNVVIDGSIS